MIDMKPIEHANPEFFNSSPIKFESEIIALCSKGAIAPINVDKRI